MHDTIKPQTINAIIVEKYEDNDRATTYIVIQHNESIYVDYSIYKKLLVGDSVIKNFDDLKYTVLRDSLILEFYPECDGKVYK